MGSKPATIRRGLDGIGFYTLSDARARRTGPNEDLQRCELIVTDRCNFRCEYCRGLKPEYKGDMPLDVAEEWLRLWIDNGLKNVRFSGGEPTLYRHLSRLVCMCRDGGVKHIAVSTNGTADLALYKHLVQCGVNDYSISLDACCASKGAAIARVKKAQWKRVAENIKTLAATTYVTVGVVLTESNIEDVADIVAYAKRLGVSDIRLIPSAQYGPRANIGTASGGMPILDYRLNNFASGRAARGISDSDCDRCYLVFDDMAAAGTHHYPCIIYLREQGAPIGDLSGSVRSDRLRWFNEHNTHTDPICRQNCLDVCVDYNNTADRARSNGKQEQGEGQARGA